MSVHVHADHIPSFRSWILKRLDSNEDATDLAEYIVALVDTSESEQTIRDKCNEELEFFLKGKTKDFVNVLIAGIKNRTYMIGAKTPAGPKIPTFEVAPGDDPAASTTATKTKRKRGDDGDADEASRAAKQQRGFNQGVQPPRAPAALRAGVPRGPRGAKARAAAHSMNAKAAAFVPQAAFAAQSNAEVTIPCFDYILNGLCASGARCSLFHPYAITRGKTPRVIQGPHRTQDLTHPFAADGAYIRPDIPNLPATKFTPTLKQPKKKWTRSVLSSTGPSHDSRNTTLVVELIPRSFCNNESIESAFARFGKITDLDLYPQDSIAVITYKTHSHARAAYESPIPLFNNRFVKVYWRRMDEPLNVTSAPETPFDHEAFAIQAKQAQERFEERQRRMAEYEAQRVEIEELTVQLQQKARELREEIEMRERRQKPGVTPDSETEELRTLLDGLKKQAASAGLDPDGPDASVRTSYRASPAGREGAQAWTRKRRIGVKRLDHRPKTLRINPLLTANLTAASVDEALRAFFFTHDLAHTSIEPAGDSTLACIARFAERFHADAFVDVVLKAGGQIPELGPVTLKWIRADEAVGEHAGALSPEDDTAADAMSGDELVILGSQNGDEDEPVREREGSRRPVKDLDVADDADDAWMY